MIYGERVPRENCIDLNDRHIVCFAPVGVYLLGISQTDYHCQDIPIRASYLHNN